jgi:hypothetical protein
MLALHAAARKARDAEHFAAILQLETQTKARLRTLLLRHGWSLAEAADLAIIPVRLDTYRSSSWHDYAAATAARLSVVVAHYRAIAALGPPKDQDVLQAVVDHEQALVDWSAAEARGENGLAAITRLLPTELHPPPRPTA